MRAHLLIALLAGCNYPEFAFAPVADGASVETAETAAIDSAAEEVADTAVADVADTASPPDTPAPVYRAWLFDFGAGDATTPGYNNVTQGLAAGGTLSNLVDSTGATTGAALRVDGMDSFHTDGANGAGTTTPGASVPFAASATRDTLYGATMTWMGELSPRASVELTGLDPKLAYELEIFASRMAGTGVLETAYTVDGTTVTLDANDNTANTARFTKLRPTAAGALTLTVVAGPKNTSPYGFYYLGAMRLAAVPP